MHSSRRKTRDACTYQSKQWYLYQVSSLFSRPFLLLPMNSPRITFERGGQMDGRMLKAQRITEDGVRDSWLLVMMMVMVVDVMVVVAVVER